MDVTTIISTVITILTLGLALYGSYRSNVSKHKTTQGKVDSVIATTVENKTTIEKLASDLEDLKKLLTPK